MGVKLRERKPGEWWLFIDHKGKRKAKKIGSREAAEAAKAQLEEALGKKDLRLRTKAEIVTVRQYAEQWMKGHVAKNLKPETIRDYRDTLDRFILPEFGACAIDEIRRDEIKAHCFRLLDKKYPKGTDKETGETIYKTYTKTTVHHVVRVMSAFINHAIEDGLVTVNMAASPGKFVKLPKAGSKADVLTPEETDHLLETTREHYPDLYPLMFTLFRTTLRKGEVRGLQWGDLDFHGQLADLWGNGG